MATIIDAGDPAAVVAVSAIRAYDVTQARRLLTDHPPMATADEVTGAFWLTRLGGRRPAAAYRLDRYPTCTASQTGRQQDALMDKQIPRPDRLGDDQVRRGRSPPGPARPARRPRRPFRP
jgi:hypothetical protein